LDLLVFKAGVPGDLVSTGLGWIFSSLLFPHGHICSNGFWCWDGVWGLVFFTFPSFSTPGSFWRHFWFLVFPTLIQTRGLQLPSGPPCPPVIFPYVGGGREWFPNFSHLDFFKGFLFLCSNSFAFLRHRLGWGWISDSPQNVGFFVQGFLFFFLSCGFIPFWGNCLFFWYLTVLGLAGALGTSCFPPSLSQR